MGPLSKILVPTKGVCMSKKKSLIKKPKQSKTPSKNTSGGFGKEELANVSESPGTSSHFEELWMKRRLNR